MNDQLVHWQDRTEDEHVLRLARAILLPPRDQLDQGRGILNMNANDNGIESLLESGDFDYRIPPPVGWTPLAEWSDLRNPDWLPDWLTRSEGCEVCGAAFVEIDALLLGATVINAVRAEPFQAHVDGTQRVLGARYICHAGHPACHKPMDPVLLAILGGGVAVGLAAMKYAGWLTGKGN